MYLPKFTKLWTESAWMRMRGAGKTAAVVGVLYGNLTSSLSHVQLIIQLRLHRYFPTKARSGKKTRGKHLNKLFLIPIHTSNGVNQNYSNLLLIFFKDVFLKSTSL